MITPATDAVARLAFAGQGLFAVGMIILAGAMLMGTRRANGPNPAWVMLGGSLVTLGTLALYLGRAAGGVVEVGVVPQSILVIIMVLLMALLVVRMSSGKSRQERVVSGIQQSATDATLSPLYAMLAVIYVIPVLVVGWRTVHRAVVAPEPEKKLVIAHTVTRTQRAEIKTPDSQGISVRIAEGSTAREAVLRCRMRTVPLVFVEGVAELDELPFGPCLLYMPPAQRPADDIRPGDELVCDIQDSEAVCEGGWIRGNMGRIQVQSEEAGTVRIGGGQEKPLPADAARVRPSTHRVHVTLEQGLEATWEIEVGAAEDVVVEVFTAPEGRDGAGAM